MIKLDVPYLSQHGNAVLNDCGGTLIAMLANASLEEVLADGEALGVKMPMSFQESYTLLRYYRLGDHTGYMRPLKIPQIKAALARRLPVIVLANYGRIPRERRQSSFKGAHWFLAVGYDEGGVYVHDPNWKGARVQEGAYMYLENALLDTMMAKPGGDDPDWQAQPYQGIVVKRPFPILEETEDAPPVSDTEADVIDRLVVELEKWKFDHADLQKKYKELELVVSKTVADLQPFVTK